MRYLVIDSDNICWRCFHATNGRFTLNTNVIYGFFSSVFNYRRIAQTDKYIFCWDKGIPFRREIYPNYKITRSKKKEEDQGAGLEQCYEQMRAIRKEILPYVGFNNVFAYKGYEADDLIASVVKEEGKFTIASSDKDLYQLLGPNVQMILPHKNELYTEWDFRLEYGIAPKKWWRVKSLAGCTSDSIKGAIGVGDITAIKYLKKELTKGKKYEELNNREKELITQNKPLVKLPFEGTPKLEIQEDNLNRQNWNEVMDKYKIRKIKLLFPSYSGDE